MLSKINFQQDTKALLRSGTDVWWWVQIHCYKRCSIRFQVWTLWRPVKFFPTRVCNLILWWNKDLFSLITRITKSVNQKEVFHHVIQTDVSTFGWLLSSTHLTSWNLGNVTLITIKRFITCPRKKKRKEKKILWAKKNNNKKQQPLTGYSMIMIN